MTDVMSVLAWLVIVMQAVLIVGMIVVWYRVRRGLAEDTAELQRQVDETKAERAGGATGC